MTATALRSFAALLLGLSVAACNSRGPSDDTEPTPGATATPAATPTASPSPVPTATPAVTPTPTAGGSTPTPAPTATPASTPTPSPSSAPTPTPTPPTTASGHPRLWVTAADLPRLRALVSASNPYWEDGLKLAAERAVSDMDEGRVATDCGGSAYTEYPTESYAEFFAFLSLVAPEAQRAGYAQRARQLLMTVITEADKGPATDANVQCDGYAQYPRFRDPDFATSDRDRARYHGEAFGLAADWIYSSLSATDRASIRRVFLRWSEEIITRGYHHPEPVGVLNDPQLYADRDQRRFSGNNYYGAHMRNLALMALALDPADDPDGSLRGYLDNATGAYFYIFKELARDESAGGLLPEGFEYSPQTASYITQFLLALNTAGAGGADANALSTQPFWNDFVTAYLHSLSPDTVVRDDSRGAEYEPAFYGDAQDYQLPDFIDSMAPLGLQALRAGNTTRLNATRWIALNTPAGGTAQATRRISNPSDLRVAVLYFMLFDPTSTATDPRPSLAKGFLAPGPERLFARTAWTTNATWFTYALPWNSVDHQNAEGNSFAFYRDGEWLTKTTLGYANIGESITSTEYANGLCIENDRPDRDESDYRIDLWKRGSQWYLGSDGDPELLASSFGADYTYALGDATELYNSSNENSLDVQDATRSILWLQPDFIFVYDRAATGKADRFKRFWLQLPNPATITGSRAVARTDGGQQLGVTSLLPAGATLRSVTGDDFDPDIADKIAQNEPMTARLSITAPGNPQVARFLTVLQGADSGAVLATPTLVQTSDGAWQGAAAGSVLVLFPRDIGTAGTFTLTAPAGLTRALVTGLTPNGSYTLQRNGNTLTLTASGSQRADAGGVLTVAF